MRESLASLPPFGPSRCAAWLGLGSGLRLGSGSESRFAAQARSCVLTVAILYLLVRARVRASVAILAAAILTVAVLTMAILTMDTCAARGVMGLAESAPG